jgi:hypothetical protein
MKKNKFFLLGMATLTLAFIGLVLTGCGKGGGGDPKKVVASYLAAASAGKFNDAKKYLTGKELEDVESSLKQWGDSKESMALAAGLFSGMKVLDGDPEIDGDKATVKYQGIMGSATARVV